METTQDTQALDWSTVAEGWDRNRDRVEAMKAQLTAALLAGLRLAPGERVLELGAGTGALARRLAEAVRPGGTVIASDVAPGMVDVIRASTQDVPGIEAAQIDACDIPLADASVDVVVFRMGLMLLGDPARALAECRRVLTPGGRLAVAVWAGPEHNPWLTTVGMAAMMHGLVQGGPPTGPCGPFALADPDTFSRLVAAAGFDDVTVRAVDEVAPVGIADEHFETVRHLAPHLAATIAAAPAEQLAAVRTTAAHLLDRYGGDGGLRIPVRSLLCLGRR